MIAMQSAVRTGLSTLTEGGALSAAELLGVVRSQAEKIAALEHQLDWFRRQLFGQKSERVAPEPDPAQLHLGEAFPVPAERAEERKAIGAHMRRAVTKDGAAEAGEELKFFDESQVPVQTITLVHADAEGLAPDQYEVIGEKITYRLAQRPGVYHVIKYLRPVIKLKASAKILCLSAPGRRPGREPGGCELHRRTARGQVRLAPAALPPAPAPGGRRDPQAARG